MVLIDTSSWTHALRRKGDPAVRARVDQLLAAQEAAWCDMVRVELWHGSVSESDRKLLEDLEHELPSLAINDEVWDKACVVGRLARTKGLNVPNTDLVVFSCALVHEVALEHNDRHFVKLYELVTGPQSGSKG
jgi:predicted nucleic acid-binding protein